MNCFLYLCPQTRENYHGKIKSDKRKIYEAIKNVPVNVPVNVPNLASMLGVSEKTIKRDIATMQSAGLIKRVGSEVSMCPKTYISVPVSRTRRTST